MVFAIVGSVLGCGVLSPPLSTPVLDVSEAFDVPPPPGQRTLRLTLQAPRACALGEPVQILQGDAPVTTGDPVDCSVEPPSLTVYLPQEAADAVLDGRALTVR